ncbi:GDP-mannose 4,6-dehydratase [Candidatus Peregrinibacteria bacterium]|nr:GDP-mannose 4,6-dehydratase [Candidatus Peregrinibacteria bacterium]
MAKIALITGITGQDGPYLAQFLLEKGYKVYGTYRRISTPNFWRMEYLGIQDQVELIPIDLIDTASMFRALQKAQPDEIYNLAAQSFVGASFDEPIATGNISGLSVTRLLDAIRCFNPKIKFYQASTSEMYGNPLEIPQNEKTPFAPCSPYAAAKLYAHWITKNYREAYNLFVCSGILFNHESPIRGIEFVTRKITNCVAKIKYGISDKLVLGNLQSKRDWGYAKDYVEGMWQMLQQDEPDDYVLATGENHTVSEFAQKAFEYVGLDYKKYLQVDKRYFRPSDVEILIGDPTKAREKLGWNPQKTSFDELIKIMMDADLKRYEFKNHSS